MQHTPRSGPGVLGRALREPLLHFFALGAVLFALHRYGVGTPRTIVVGPGVVADVERRFRDERGRPPTAQELSEKLAEWKRDEALFREALVRHLDRDDPAVRAVLVSKMRTLAELELEPREPTEAELREWHRSEAARYAQPQRYDFQLLRFPEATPGAKAGAGAPASSASAERERVARAIAGGAPPASLGHPVQGGKWTAETLRARLGSAMAARIESQAPGPWQPFETDGALLLVRVKGVEGGLPPLEELRPRLVADWSLAQREAAIERVLQRTVSKYRFEEEP